MNIIWYGDDDWYHFHIDQWDYKFDLEWYEWNDSIINFWQDEWYEYMNGWIMDDEWCINVSSEHRLFRVILKRYWSLEAEDKIESFLNRVEEESDMLENLKRVKESERTDKADLERKMNQVIYWVSNGGRPKIPDIVDTRYEWIKSYSSKWTWVHYNTLKKWTKYTKHMKDRYLRNSDILKLVIWDLWEDILILK